MAAGFVHQAFSVGGLMERAAALAGTSDWGDLSFTEPLELLVRSCRRTAGLTPDGWAVLEKVLLRHLRNRLYVQAYVAEHVDRLAPPVRDTVVITGLPRTGTTLLHNLLACDPANRVLRLWEALHPVPPADEQRQAQLVDRAASWLDALYRLAPDFRAIHASSPDGPEECDALLQNTFASQHFDDMFDAEEYSRWLYATPLGDAYRFYALQLQVLTRAEDTGSTWTLKSPSHLAHLDSLLAACPGTTVVHCHRDPVEAVPSYASLILAVRQPYTGAVSPSRVGEQALWRCGAAAARALEVRRRAGEDAFVDVSYRALVGDAVGVVHYLYAGLGREVSDTFDDAMRRWVAAHPQHVHGVHRYGLEQFGLSEPRVRNGLEAYLSRFAEVLGVSG